MHSFGSLKNTLINIFSLALKVRDKFVVLSLLSEMKHFISYVEIQYSNWSPAWFRNWILVKPVGKHYKDLLSHSCSLQVVSDFIVGCNCTSSCKLSL